MKKSKCKTCKHFFKTEHENKNHDSVDLCLKSGLTIYGIIKNCTKFKAKKV